MEAGNENINKKSDVKCYENETGDMVEMEEEEKGTLDWMSKTLVEDTGPESKIMKSPSKR